MTRSPLRATLSGLLAPLLLLSVLIALLAFADHKRQVTVRWTIQTNEPGRLQIFHDAKGRFAEARSFWLDLAPGPPAVTDIGIPGDSGGWLRLDPPAGAIVTVCGIGLEASVPAQFEILHASELAVVQQAQCLRTQSDRAARDPQFALHFTGESTRTFDRAGTWESVWMAAWMGLLAALGWLGWKLRRNLRDTSWRLPVLPGLDGFQRQAHWVCATLMLAFGIAYLAVTPPGAVADEEAHLAKIVRISAGVPFGDSGTRLLPQVGDMYGPFSNYVETKQAFTYQQLRYQLQQPLICEPTATGLPPGATGYFPHHYLLSTAAYQAGCSARASFGGFLYVARLLNLLLATALVAWGVACAGRGKLGLFFIALLPMTLFQISSISADSLVLSLSVAWLGVVSGIASGTLQPRRAGAALWGLGLAVALLKPGSAWILACLLFCKPAYDAAGESFRVALGKHLWLPWAIHLAWTLGAAGHASSPPGVDPALQLHALSSDPLGFLQTLAMTFRDHGAGLGRMLVGILGWLDVPLSSWVYPMAGVLGLVAMCSNDESSPPMPGHAVALAWLAIAGSLVVISLPLFVYWTPVGSQVIQGLQGRYFIPPAAFMLVWCGFRCPRGVRAVIALAILFGALAMNADAIQRLYEAYYVTGR